MIKRNLTVIGLKSNSKHYIAHHTNVPNLYKENTRLLDLDTKSVMHVADSLKNFNYWNLDSDAFYLEDSVGWTKALDVSGNSFDYFKEFPKIYRVAHSLFEEDSFFENEWTKNKQHILEIYNNFLVSNLIWVSPVLVAILRKTMPQVLSKKQISRIEQKLMVLPPPDYYKLNTILNTTVAPKSFKPKLSFLWNHRFVSLKNPKIFFSIIEAFTTAYPKIPIEIRICSLGTEKEAMAFVPEKLRAFVVWHPFMYGSQKYSKFIEPANITIGTSRIESFGISVFDAIRAGLTYINSTSNVAFSTIAGLDTTVSPKEIPNVVYKLYTDAKFRKTWDQYNVAALNSLPNVQKAKNIFTERVNAIIDEKIQNAKGDNSQKLKIALKVLEKQALSKQDLYRTLGWEPTATCRNAFWVNIIGLFVNTAFIQN